MASSRLVSIEKIQDAVLADVSRALHRSITFSRGNISFHPGPSFTLHDVVIQERDGRSTFFSARTLTFKLAILPLLQRKVVLSGMEIDHPRLNLERATDGLLNVADLLEDQSTSSALEVLGVGIQGGTLVFTDRTVKPSISPLVLDELDLTLGHMERGRKTRLKLAGILKKDGKNAGISASGSFRLSPVDRPLQDSEMNLNLAAKGLDLEALWPLYRSHVPFRKLQGNVDLTATLSGTPANIKTQGEVRVTGGHLDYPAAFSAPISPPAFRVSYNLSASKDKVDVSSISLHSPILSAQGRCQLTEINSGDPHILAHATIAPFRLAETSQLIPYPIIADDVADFIRRYIKDGSFSLSEGRLEGRVSKIARLGEQENYNALTIVARCQNARLQFGDSIPSFTAVAGSLELRGKDFILRGMSGRFGDSPLTLEGKITDYPLPHPSTYPFTMTVSPRQPDVAWLLGQRGNTRFSYEGKSTLNLRGDGTTSSYSLSGDWDLTPAGYSLQNQFNKPAGRANSLSFDGTLTKHGAQVRKAIFSLSPLTLEANARISYTGADPLTFTLKTNSFSLGEMARLFPKITPFQPAGKMQVAVSGGARSWDISTLQLSGEGQFSGVALKPAEMAPALSNLTGTIRFRGDTLETSRLSATMGKTTIQGKGSLTGFEHPLVSFSFSTPLLYLQDMGLSFNKEVPPVRKVSGTATYQEGKIAVKQLQATVQTSPISISGTIQTKPSLRYDLGVRSHSLDLDDLSPLGSTRQTGKQGKAPSLQGTIRLEVEEGRMKSLPFSGLQATVAQEGDIIYIEPLSMELLKGKASGRLRIDRSNPESPRYQANFDMERIASQQLYALSNSKTRMITGSLTLHGELSARGTTNEDIRRTALGNVRLRFEEGSIKQLPILSKIFSILNVSQLLKLQLPDMVRDGMPYNTITASIAVKDGLLSTSDLKIDSDALNISAIGSSNLVKEEYNLTVGVKPLQTVDKVVSRIPLIGWILTGKDKALLTAWFEVRGHWSDPQVTAIPITSLSRGVLGIFRRLLELPGKIVTNTGEVILGN
jgi:uncharacterized protein YhdP